MAATLAFEVLQAVHVCADTDLEAEVDPSVETEEKLRAEEEAAQQRLQAMQRSDPNHYSKAAVKYIGFTRDIGFA